jgi:hypothetical protein
MSFEKKYIKNMVFGPSRAPSAPGIGLRAFRIIYGL